MGNHPPHVRAAFRFWIGSIGSIFVAQAVFTPLRLLTGYNVDIATLIVTQLTWYSLAAVFSELRPPRH